MLSLAGSPIKQANVENSNPHKTTIEYKSFHMMHKKKETSNLNIFQIKN